MSARSGRGTAPSVSSERFVPSMWFMGVNTTGSSIMRLFPRWARVLGLHGARLEGRDLSLDAGEKDYRSAVVELRDDPLSFGALVTTHKLRVLSAAHDIFDELDRYAELCREVSCISKRGGRLVGHAKDPITSGRALNALLGPGYFCDSGREVLCLGAGGAGTAISAYLMSRSDPADRPERITVVSKEAAPLDALGKVHDQLSVSPTEVRYVRNGDPVENDRLVGSLPPGSLVINATGMGKDIPGSPITNDARFPKFSVAWELNYRGDLDFLSQASAQQESRGVIVADGWLYFLHGWSEAIAEVFDVELTPELFQALKDEAEAVKSGQ